MPFGYLDIEARNAIIVKLKKKLKKNNKNF
jgi:hypothetical protein